MTQWGWFESNGNATAEQTWLFWRVLQGEVPCDYFYAVVWNDLVDKVAEMRSAIGRPWDTNEGGAKLYLTQAECYATPGDPFRADVYNAVRFQVGSIKGTQVTDRVPGGEITGYHILRMVEVLNEIISEL